METDETKQFAICQNGREMRTTPELFPAPIGKLLGFTIVRDEEGKAAIEFEATESHANPMGTLHGGVLCDLADATMGVAYRSTLAPGESFTTLELKINFLRPVWKAKLRAEARVVGGGKTVGLGNATFLIRADGWWRGHPALACGCAARPLKGGSSTNRRDTRRPTGGDRNPASRRLRCSRPRRFQRFAKPSRRES